MNHSANSSRVSGTNVHIYPAPLRHQSRMRKITRTLADAKVFDRIILLGTASGSDLERERLDARREILGVPRKLFPGSSHTFGKAIRTLEWYWRVYRAIAKEHIACLNCHSLPVLPLCLVLARLKRSKLIYDTHELETETVASHGVRKRLQKRVERWLIKHVDEVIVVNGPIADWYRHAYNLRHVSVVRNVPYNNGTPAVKSGRLRELFGLNENDILFLYLGGLWHGRGTKALLEAFSTASPDKHLLMMGFGEMTALVEEYASSHRNIHFHPPVKPDEVAEYALGADVGLSLIENVCLSYYLCLPNKVFEYLIGGVPVVVSDFPVMAEVVDQYGAGWKVQPDADSIREIVQAITPKEIEEKRDQALKARETIGWNHEEPVLLQVYERLFPRNDNDLADNFRGLP